MIDFTEPFFVRLLERMDKHSSLVGEFEEYIRLGQNRRTVCNLSWAVQDQRNLSPDEMRLILTHWRMTR